jgi:hypothetical protein
MKKQDKHFLSIKQIHPDTINVVQPLTMGLVHDVYIAESENDKHICRFSQKTVAEHNLQASKLLASYNIPVPNVSIYNCGDYYCETYPFIPGKTLHERILEGLPNEQLDKVYEQLFELSYKMSEIPYDSINNTSLPVVSKILRQMIDVLNPAAHTLCHTDLHAKNVILDDQDNVRAIIDLDAITYESTFVSYFIMMRDAKMHGYDISRLSHIFKKNNMRHINAQIKAINFVTRAYHTLFPDCIRKQILKIRCK